MVRVRAAILIAEDSTEEVNSMVNISNSAFVGVINSQSDEIELSEEVINPASSGENKSDRVSE